MEGKSMIFLKNQDPEVPDSFKFIMTLEWTILVTATMFDNVKQLEREYEEL